MLTEPADIGVAYHHTSGTTGRTPFRVVHSARDWAWGANAWARALYAFGLRASDVVYLPFGYGPFIGFWGAHYAIQRIGATWNLCAKGKSGSGSPRPSASASWPIIRYRTGDLVRRVPAASCPCGRTFDLYQGGVVGRADDMRVIRGTNVYPSAVEGSCGSTRRSASSASC